MKWKEFPSRTFVFTWGGLIQDEVMSFIIWTKSDFVFKNSWPTDTDLMANSMRSGLTQR